MRSSHPDAFLLPLLLPIVLVGMFPLLVLGVVGLLGLGILGLLILFIAVGDELNATSVIPATSLRAISSPPRNGPPTVWMRARRCARPS